MKESQESLRDQIDAQLNEIDDLREELKIAEQSAAEAELKLAKIGNDVRQIESDSGDESGEMQVMDSHPSASSLCQSASSADVQVMDDSDSESASYASEEEKDVEVSLTSDTANQNTRTNTLKKKYTNLRIDDVPEPDEEEKDTFVGRTIYKKQKPPKTITSA